MRGRDLALQREIELLRIGAAERRDEPDHAPDGGSQRGEIRNRRCREAIADTRGDKLIARTHRVDRPIRRMPVETQSSSAGPIGIVEDSVAAANHSLRIKLISETEAWSVALEIALYTGG